MDQRQDKNAPVLSIDRDVTATSTYWEKGDYVLHYHRYVELELITEGSGSQIMNGVPFPLHKKDIYMMRPLEWHKVQSDGIRVDTLCVKEEFFPKWIAGRIHAFRNPVVFHLNDEEYEEINALYKMIEKETTVETGRTSEVSSLLSELLFSCFLRLDKTGTSGENGEFIQKVTYYLQHDNHFTEKVSLEDIASYVGYSKYYTSSMFHKTYGITIQEYIIGLRIEYAKKLITQTNMSIMEIVTECGFPSTSNFYTQFTKAMNCSPLQYKKKIRSI